MLYQPVYSVRARAGIHHTCPHGGAIVTNKKPLESYVGFMIMDENLYEKARKKNEFREFFFGKGEYFIFDRDWGTHDFTRTCCYIFDLKNDLGEQTLYKMIESDLIGLLSKQNLTNEEFRLVIIFIFHYYDLRNYEDKRLKTDWIFSEELILLLNFNYRHIKEKGEDFSMIEDRLNCLLMTHNVDILNFDSKKLLRKEEILSRVDKTYAGLYEVPDVIKYIDSYAFAHCKDITEIILPDSVESIGMNAFDGCTNLKNIKMPNKMTFIGRDAFFDCSSLEYITIPSTLFVNENDFCFCDSLKSINVDEENPYHKSVDGILYTKDMKTLLRCPMALSAKKLEIPYGVEVIKYASFKGCSKVKSVYIPESVSKIEFLAFCECDSLREIHFQTKDVCSFTSIAINCAGNKKLKYYFPKGTKKQYMRILDINKNNRIVEEDSGMRKQIITYFAKVCTELSAKVAIFVRK